MLHIKDSAPVWAAAANITDAMDNSLRLHIISLLLKYNELDVQTIAKRANKHISIVSRNLKKLSESGLIEFRIERTHKSGASRKIYYPLREKLNSANQAAGLLCAIWLDAKPNRPRG